MCICLIRLSVSNVVCCWGNHRCANKISRGCNCKSNSGCVKWQCVCVTVNAPSYIETVHCPIVEWYCLLLWASWCCYTSEVVNHQQASLDQRWNISGPILHRHVTLKCRGCVYNSILSPYAKSVASFTTFWTPSRGPGILRRIPTCPLISSFFYSSKGAARREPSRLAHNSLI